MPETDRKTVPVPQAWLSTRQAAHCLGLTSKILEHWRSRGGGPPYAKLGRNVRYSRTTLDGWATARTIGNTSQQVRK